MKRGQAESESGGLTPSTREAKCEGDGGLRQRRGGRTTLKAEARGHAETTMSLGGSMLATTARHGGRGRGGGDLRLGRAWLSVNPSVAAE